MNGNQILDLREAPQLHRPHCNPPKMHINPFVPDLQVVSNEFPVKHDYFPDFTAYSGERGQNPPQTALHLHRGNVFSKYIAHHPHHSRHKVLMSRFENCCVRSRYRIG